MNIHPSAYKVFIPFGKHKGKSFGFIAEMDSAYLEWLSGSDAMPIMYRTASAKTLLGEPVEIVTPSKSPSPKLPSVPKPMGKVDMWYLAKRDMIGVRFELIGDILERFKSMVDGRVWNSVDGCWEFPTAQLPIAVKLFGAANCKVTESVKTAYRKEIEYRKRLDEIRNKETTELDAPTLLPLRAYQNITIEFALEANGRCLIGHSPGLGKTAVAIGFTLMVGGNTLIICPKSVKLQWKKEILKYAGEISCVWDSDGPQGNKNAHYHIINYDIVDRHIKEFNKMEFETLICDEATKIKNYKSIRYKAIVGSWKERKKYPGISSQNVLLLTGTPILNRPMELYTLLSFLDKKRFNNPVVFKNRYEGDGLTIRGQNLDELHDRTKQLIIRYTKDKLKGELPAKSRSNILIEMTPTENKAYNKHLDELFRKWKLNGKPSAAHMPAIRDYLFELKFPRIIEWIDDMLDADRNVLVFSVQQRHAERIAEYYGDRARLVHGKITDDLIRQKNIDDLCAKKARVGSFTIIAGGMGIDGLQHAMSDVLFVDRWFVPADHEQAEDRLNRFGQKEPTNNYYVTVMDTLDEDMAEVLEEKQKVIDHAIDGKAPLSDKDLSKVANTSIFKEVAQRMVYKRGLQLSDADETELEVVEG
jgi:SNF2 family DNA or RNA helicase